MSVIEKLVDEAAALVTDVVSSRHFLISLRPSSRQQLRDIIIRAVEHGEHIENTHSGLRIFRDTDNQIRIEWTSEGRTVSIPMTAIAEKFPMVGDTVLDWLAEQG